MNKLDIILDTIIEAITDGRISIHIDSSDDSYIVSDEAEGILPMLVHNLADYLKEEKPELYKNLLSSIALCENGDVMLHTNAAGLEYYKKNKEDLYTAIYLKSGCHRVYVYAEDVTEVWVQTEKDHIVKNMGQIPHFGAQLTQNAELEMQENEDNRDNELVDTPLLSIKELAQNIPSNLSDVKLHATDLGQIIQIIQTRLTAMSLESLEEAIYEKQNQS